MPGRKGQRSGGHNKKSAEEHQRDGTRSHEGETNAPVAGALDSVMAVVGTDSGSEMDRLYRIYVAAANQWAMDPGDKDSRLSATAAFDRYMRIASELAREKPKEEPPHQPSDGPSLSMADLLKSRGGNGASETAG